MKNQHTPGLLSRRQEGQVLAIRKDAKNRMIAGNQFEDHREKPETLRAD